MRGDEVRLGEAKGSKAHSGDVCASAMPKFTRPRRGQGTSDGSGDGWQWAAGFQVVSAWGGG